MENLNEGDNTGLTKEKVDAELKRFGKAFGTGQNSRPAAALLCVDAAARVNGIGPDDAEELYTKFAKAAALSQGIEYSAQASFKVQASKLKRFLMLGVLPGIDGVDVMNRTVDKITALSRQAESPLKGSAYDNMVLVARRQIEQPKTPLTDDEIVEVLSEQPEEKSALDKVIDLYKKAYRLEEVLREAGIGDVTFAEQATLDLAEQIKAMDGDLPAMTKEDRVLEKASKIIAKRSKFLTREETLKVPSAEIVGSLNVEPAQGEDHGAESAAA